jgi:G3E family GTPase
LYVGGNFWASISEVTMEEFFSQKPNEYQRILKDDFITTEFGDRRQEIVFIGIQLLENEISMALNDCLLTDDEMIVYRSELLKKNTII